MKNISTLVADVKDILVNEKKFVNDTITQFSANLSEMLVSRLSREQAPPSLRVSNLGKPNRRLWYDINKPHLAEPLSASTRFKFLFGDIIEHVLLFLADASGHKVTDEQAEVDIAGIKGHIDGRIDGELVDVKSASTYSFRKFKDHLRPWDDAFGYLTQLGSYGYSLGVDRAHFFVADKSVGNICLDTHDLPAVNYNQRVQEKQKMLSGPIPERCYPDEADGVSGNRKLSVGCSYCPFKQHCWPGLRTFLYSRGPVFLTVVARRPRDDIVEVTGQSLEE